MTDENKTETVADIIAYMRGQREFYGAEYAALADRIDAAHAREIAELSETVEANLRVHKAAEQQADERIFALTEEIARLKAALKPVMAVNMNMGANYSDMFFAVRKSQRIMKEAAE